MSVNNYYELTLELLDKTQSTPTTVAIGRIDDGDLRPYRSSLVLTNTGNTKTDSGVLTLRIPPDGTFVRTEPILVNEQAKDRFVIQAQIRQSDGSGGTRNGKIFRFIVGTPTITDSVADGETLILNLIPIEYRLKEHIQSNQLFFVSPRDSFQRRLLDYNITKGASNPAVVFNSTTPTLPARPDIDLPDDDTLKQNYLPNAPRDTHSLLWDIINRLSLPSTSGGTFTDYYFEMEASSTNGDVSTGAINVFNARAEPFGYQDSGIIIDPLSLVSPVDAEKDKTVMTDLVKFKNNIILEGSSSYGSLPMARTKFNSQWQHGKVRPEYNSSNKYYDGSDGVNGQSLVKTTESIFSFSDINKKSERYFKYTGTNGIVPPANQSPLILNQTSWYEDFTTIPEYTDKAQYEEKDIITKTNTASGVIEFFCLKPVSISTITSTLLYEVTVVTSTNHNLVTGQKFDGIEGTVNYNFRKTGLKSGITRVSDTKFYFSTFRPMTYAQETTGNILGGNTHVKGDPTPVNGTAGWVKVFADTNTSKYEPFWSYTPWTSDYDLQQCNMSGVPEIPLWDSTTPYVGTLDDVLNVSDEVQYNGKWYRALVNNNNSAPTGSTSVNWYKIDDSVPTFAGTFPDWNLERANYDRVESEDQFEQISMKAVYRVVSSVASYNGSNYGVPSTAEKQNGSRFLLKGVSDAYWATTEFAGTNNNKVVEWFEPLNSVGEWRYSKIPTNKNDELVVDLRDGRVWGWDGTSWSIKWNPKKPVNATKSTPFHCVSNGNMLSQDATNATVAKMGFGLVRGATQIPAQAIRFLYHWDTTWGSKLNYSSRGAWFCMHLPLPRKAVGTPTKEIGSIYKQSLLDTMNLDRDSKGGMGWNNGLDSEDLGKISALSMKVRLSAYDSTDTEVQGYANMPMKAWAIDVFGRIWFTDFTLKHMGQYGHVRIAFGHQSPSTLYHNRIDELFSVFDFTFSQNFTLKQKEFTGIAFDWRFVKSWGIFWNVSYDDNGLYIGSRDTWLDTIKQWASQAWSSSLNFLFGEVAPLERFVVDYTTLDIDELAFEKQLYANSDDVSLTDPRTQLMSEVQEIDYNNLKINAKAKKARAKFISQQWHILSHGDVRMRLGRKFKITGSRVPENVDNYTAWYPTGVGTNYAIGAKVSRGGYVWQSIKYPNQAKTPETETTYWLNLNESTCHEVVHHIDASGYTMNVSGVRKFVYSE